MVLQLALNEDFSFVRALKVVKTLYESSQFTQLGRTVGIALDPMQGIEQQAMDMASESVEDGPAPDSEAIKSPGSTIFDVIAEACNSNKHKNEALDTSLSVPSSPAKQSLLEQVMNCTLLSPGGDDVNFSFDHDSYRSADNEDTFDDEYDEAFESYDSEEESRRRRRRRRRNRRR